MQLDTSQSRATLVENAFSAAQLSNQAAQGDLKKAQDKAKRLQRDVKKLKDASAELTSAKKQLEEHIADVGYFLSA